jgi:hypothetical protein
LVAAGIATVAWGIVFANVRGSEGGRFGVAGLARRIAEVGKNGLLLNLTLAQGGQVVGDGFLFVEADLAGVGADETLVEYASRKLVKVFLFQGTQHARADFGGVGDGVERKSALFALFAKFFSERSQG